MTADAFTIRPARADDAAAIAAIYAHHVLTGTATFDLEPRSPGEMAARIESSAERGYPFLVAEHGGALAGYAYAGPFRDRPAYASTCEDSIYVGPDHLGRGIGRALLLALVDAAAAAGFRQMIAVIGGAEPSSAAVHARAGFVETGRLPAAGYKFGRWLDVLFMQRPLGPADSSPPTH